jgi:hypothetical protein
MGHFSSLLNESQSMLAVYKRTHTRAPALIVMSFSDAISLFEINRTALEQMYLKTVPKIVVFAPNC